MSTVLVLGAGFSRAVSTALPVTDELGRLVMKHLHDTGQDVRTPRPYLGRRFEAWLSRLAEPQPDLDEADNLRNRELFVRVTNAVRDVVEAAQLEAIGNRPPWWLQRLVGCVHHTRSTVITFNYDTLFELAVEYAWLADDDGHGVHVGDVLRHMPMVAERPNTGVVYGSPRANSMRLIKLHGSIDTYWVTEDATGATIRRWEQAGMWTKPEAPDHERRQQLLPGRAPFIVPPASGKSGFYQNPLTRQLWRDAAQALATADEVVFAGYSLPATDLVSSGMFGEHLAASNASVVVVNPDPEPPLATLRELGVDEPRICVIEGCAEYVDLLERRLKPGLLRDDGIDQLPVAISMRNRPMFDVTDVALGVDPTEVVLHARKRNQTQLYSPRSFTVGDIRRKAPALSRIRVRFETGEEAHVHSSRTGNADGGAGAAHLLLEPTAFPRDL